MTPIQQWWDRAPNFGDCSKFWLIVKLPQKLLLNSAFMWSDAGITQNCRFLRKWHINENHASLEKWTQKIPWSLVNWHKNYSKLPLFFSFFFGENVTEKKLRILIISWLGNSECNLTLVNVLFLEMTESERLTSNLVFNSTLLPVIFK